MTNLPLIFIIPFLVSILAGKVTRCVIPLIVNFPLTIFSSTFIGSNLLIKNVEKGNFLTSKKSGSFKCSII